MFPPLCFIDITKGEVSQKETEKTMKKVLTEQEYEAVDNSKPIEKASEHIRQDENKEDNKIIIKFKIVELFHELFGKK
jgi:stage II sporulation protein R